MHCHEIDNTISTDLFWFHVKQILWKPFNKQREKSKQETSNNLCNWLLCDVYYPSLQTDVYFNPVEEIIQIEV